MHNFLGLDRKHDNFRKGVFIDPYDEPTYLTFALDFKFENTPTNSPHDEANLGNSPLFNSETSNSAINYLISRGYEAQADGMATFREILRYLTFQAPWYFQSISGLDELYAQATDQSIGYKAKEGKITVNTLEAIDLRIHELAGLYRNAIFDNKFRRERVPDNLRWFSMDVYVAEFRNIRYRLPGVAQGAANALGIDTGAIGNVLGGGNAFSNILDQFGYMKFTCRQCEFDFSQTTPFGRSIDVGGEHKQETNEFSINVGWIDEEVKFGDGSKIYDDPVKTDIRNPWGGRNLGTQAQNIGGFLSGLPVIGDSIQNAGQKVMDGLSKVGGFINPALDAASTFVDPTVRSLGDMYDSGYTTNGDTVPKRSKPSGGNVY